MPKIDLNLLRVFEMVYEVRSVTRAAERLGLTQSAVSHALARLRASIGDPLFVRHPDGLQPTALAIEIAPGVRDGLEQLKVALAPTPFDPATAARQFRINTGIYFSTLLVPRLIARLRKEAPSVSFEIIAPGADLLASLDSGTTDIAIGAFGKAPSRLLREALFLEDLVWIARGAGPVGRDPSLLSEIPKSHRLRVAVGRPFPGHGAYSWENGLERLVTASSQNDSLDDMERDGTTSVHDPLTAIATVAASDLVAAVPRRLALRATFTHDIAIVDAEPVNKIEMAMLWHSRLSNDFGLEWLRKEIKLCLEADRAS